MTTRTRTAGREAVAGSKGKPRTAKVRTILTGFCNPSHDEDSHGRCSGLVSELMCRCDCHPHRTVTYPEGKGHMVECRCNWLKYLATKDAADREGAAHVRARNKQVDDR